MDMNEIIISTPGELIGVDVLENRSQDYLAFLRLGHFYSPSRLIKTVAQYAKNVERESYYFLLQLDDNFLFGKIQEADIYYSHFCSDCKRRPETVDFLIELPEQEYLELIRAFLTRLSSFGSHLCVFQFGKMWKAIRFQNFKGMILKRDHESAKELKEFGVGLLLMLGELLNSYDKQIY